MPGGRARWPSRIAVGIECLLAVALAFGPLLTVTPLGSPAAIDVPNPFAVLPSATFWAAASAPTDLFVLMFLVFFLGVGHLLIRWRRSAGLERLQYRWLVAALVLVAATSLIWAFATLQLGMDTNGPTYVLVVLSYPSVPLAIGIAVVRYRLYQIDRIISRTVGWAIVTAVLVAVFVALVVGLQAALTDVTQGQTLAVAASTLVAFALFQPVRRRVQRAVDRRFDRARYDAERTATAFADRLRDETDIAAVTGDLATTARAALAPTTLTVWLRTGRP